MPGPSAKTLQHGFALALLLVASSGRTAASGYSPGALLAPSSRPQMALLGTGEVLIAGDGAPTLYQPATGRIRAVPGAPTLQAGRTMTVLWDGRVLFTGGSPATASAQLFDAQLGKLTSLPAMANARSDAAAVRLSSGEVMVVGGVGADGKPLASAEIFNPRTASFRAVAAMSRPRQQHCAMLLLDGRVAVLGGASTAVEVYDPAANRWTVAPASLGVARTQPACVRLVDGSLLVLGGLAAGGPSGAVEKLAPDVSRVQSLAPLQNARQGLSATVLASNDVLVAGGQNASGAVLSSTERVGSAGYAGQGPSLPTPVSGHASVLLPTGGVLLAGGQTFGGAAVAALQILDIHQETLDAGAVLPVSLQSSTGGLVPSGEGLVLGGDDRADGGGSLTIARISPAGDTAQAIGSALGPHYRGRSALLLDGEVVLYGNFQGNVWQASPEVIDPVSGLARATGPTADSHFLGHLTALPSGEAMVAGDARSERFQPDSGQWIPDAPFLSSRSEPDVLLLPDGRVLLSGGWACASGCRTVPSAELWSPPTGWSDGGRMTTGHYQHHALVLPDGRAWVIGGVDFNDAGSTYVVSSTDFFDPDGGSWSAGPPLSQGAYSVGTAVLPSGKAVVAGGLPSVFNLFDPVRNQLVLGPALPSINNEDSTVYVTSKGSLLLTGGPTGSATSFLYDEGYGKAWQGALLSECQASWPGQTLRFTVGPLLDSAFQAPGSELPVALLQNTSNHFQQYLPTRLLGPFVGEMDLPASLIPGWYTLRVVVHGVPSESVMMRVAGPPGQACSASWQCGTGACTAGACSGASCLLTPGFDGGLPLFADVPPVGPFAIGCSCQSSALGSGFGLALVGCVGLWAWVRRRRPRAS